MSAIKPAIAVVLPVYNGGALLRIAVESVLAQTLQNFEFIIADDGSSDHSWDYLQALDDPRVRVIRQPHNLGLFGNLNALIAQTCCDLIKIWSQDDIMYPHCLAETLSFHQRYPALPMSYSDHDNIDGDGQIINRYDGSDPTPEVISIALHHRISLYVGPIAANIAIVTINKKYLANLGPFREDLRFSGDFDMWERMGAQHAIGKIRKVLIQLRDHAGQLSRKPGFEIQQLKDDLQVTDRLLARAAVSGCYKRARSILAWRRHVYYFSVLLSFVRSGHWRLAGKYYAVLRTRSFMPALAGRWLVRKLSKMLGIEIDPIQVAQWQEELARSEPSTD
jgi:glycosyltransferase involved in cell wall biosynthesis